MGKTEQGHFTGDQFCLKRKREYQTKLIALNFFSVHKSRNRMSVLVYLKHFSQISKFWKAKTIKETEFT